MPRSTRIMPAILFLRPCQQFRKHSFTGVIESRWTCVMRRKEERQMGPEKSDSKGMFCIVYSTEFPKNVMYCTHWQTGAYILLFYLCTEAYTLTDIHLWLQPLSAKCQPDKSQGLKVKWNINILTNRAESQEYYAELPRRWWLHFCLTLLQFAHSSGEYE